MSKKTTTAKTARNAQVDIGLSKEARAAVAKLLAGVLGDQHVLYVKTRNFHWNLVGHRFHTLHSYFEAQYTALAAAIDETAERIRMLGEASPGSMAEFLEAASLSEAKGSLIDGDAAISALLDDHEAACRSLREAITACEEEHDDAGTADFLTGLLQVHEKQAWMLRSFLR